MVVHDHRSSCQVDHQEVQQVNEMDAWVEFYEANGLTYFPLYGIMNGACRCKAGADCKGNTGKHPVFSWKGKPSRKPRVTDNIGISTDNLVIVDLDGDVPESALNEYPGTFTTGTGHGYHLWYRADPSKPVKSVVGWKHKVDVRAMGGLIAAPPSRHRNGSVYRHVRGETIQPVPRWLLDSLPAKTEFKRRVGYEVTNVPSSTHGIMAPIGRQLVQAMLDWDESRNQTLFKVGCRFFEMAAVGNLGEDVLRDIMGAALETGLTADEIERTLNSARNSV